MVLPDNIQDSATHYNLDINHATNKEYNGWRGIPGGPGSAGGIPLFSGIIVLQRPLGGSKDTVESGVKMFKVEETTLVAQQEGADSYYGAVNHNFCQGVV